MNSTNNDLGLFEAIRDGDFENVKRLLPSVNAMGENWIHWATFFNKIEILKYLLEYIRIDVDLQTCGHLACRAGNEEILKLLIDKGFNKEIRNGSGELSSELAISQNLKRMLGNKSSGIKIDGLDVYFPYEHIYPEQYQYMFDLLQCLRAERNGHCLLEMPCGTGKTIALLSLIVSFQLRNQNAGKLIYCTRTVTEMFQVFREMKVLHQHLISEFGRSPVVCVGLTSRKNYCIHDNIDGKELNSDQSDSVCRNLTASWIVERAKENPVIETCAHYTNLRTHQDFKSLLPPGVYSLEDLKVFGRNNRICPYFFARHAIEFANVVVCNYAYLLDPKISAMFRENFGKNCMVVFDEAHNIDDVCIEALSINIDSYVLKQAKNNIQSLKRQIETESETYQKRLQDEYNRLVSGLQTPGVGYVDQVRTNPVLPQDIMTEAVPGTIRRGQHFLNFLRRFIQYIGASIEVKSTETHFPNTYILQMNKTMFIDQKTLKFVAQRLVSLMNTLEISNVYDYLPIRLICDFATLLGTYQDGFSILIEPFDGRTPTIYDPILQFCCLDSRIAIKNVFDTFKTVIITSGTLSPLDIYPQLLGFNPVLKKSFPMTMVRNCICPVILTKGSDQVPLSSKYNVRSDRSIVRNYGNILIEVSGTVPDGIVCFFPSYHYMEEVFNKWENMGIINEVQKSKLIFIETPNTHRCGLALMNFRKACDAGRGAVFLCVARGKVSEGVDFDGHYGRCVIMIGIPFLNPKSKTLESRVEFLEKNNRIKRDKFFNFDAIRTTSQCIGRVLRNKTDYGVMILADERYNNPMRRNMLPEWIKVHLLDENRNVSTDSAMGLIQKFLLKMSQNWDEKEILGRLLLSKDDIEKGKLVLKKPEKRKGVHYIKDKREKKKVKKMTEK